MNHSHYSIFGIGIMLLASLLVTINDALIKEILVSIETAQLLFFRGIFAVSALFAYCLIRNRLSDFSISNPMQTILLSALAVLSLLSFTYSLQFIPLATAIVLAYTSPIFVCLLSPILIHENVSKWQWLYIGICFTGVYLIVTPQSGIFTWALFLPLLSGLIIAVRDLVIRKYVKMNNTINLSIMVHVLTVLASSIFFETKWLAMDSMIWILLVCSGVAVAAGSTGMIIALKYANATSLSAIKYTCVFWGAVFGWVFFKEAISLSGFLGGALIVLGGVLVARYEHQLSLNRQIGWKV